MYALSVLLVKKCRGVATEDEKLALDVGLFLLLVKLLHGIAHLHTHTILKELCGDR